MIIKVHAGHNPDGKIGSGAVGLIKESTEARKVTKLVVEYLRQAGHKVYDNTVNNGKDKDDVLDKLVAQINKSVCDLVVSIHFNSGAKDARGNGDTAGTEVLVYALNQKPRSVANHIVNEIAKLGFDNRGVKARPELAVLCRTKYPSLLVEACFVDDRDDVSIYDAEKMAQAITLGILNSLELQTYSAKKKINSFNLKLKVKGIVKRKEICKINKFRFVDGYMLGHRLKADNWVKIKHLKLKEE